MSALPSPNGNAVPTADLVRRVFVTGQKVVDALRQQLSDDGHDADELVPLVEGGVSMHKVRSVMHDTCNCANATALEIRRLVDEAGIAHFGADAWQALPAEQREGNLL